MGAAERAPASKMTILRSGEREALARRHAEYFRDQALAVRRWGTSRGPPERWGDALV
jgi:hypothetical protein